MWSVGPVYIRDPTLVITLPADDLAPNDACDPFTNMD